MPMEWVRGKTIGHGSFASVSLAKPVNPTSGSGSGKAYPNLIAVKSCGVSHSASLMHERIILEELKDCPDIIRCFGDLVTVENGERLYNVALEYASGGALSEKVRLPENQVRRYTNSILNGLEFIHRNGFVHCDIKLQNILLVNNGGKESVKIADFGLAKREAGDVDLKYEIRGTPMYMAPETVTGGEQESPSDIWALGCLVTEMITGNPVWNCSDVGGLLMKIGVGAAIPDIPGKLSDDGKDFLGKCFVKDPRKRWTAEMLLDHPFIKSAVVDEEAEDQISPRDPFGFLDWESEQSEEEFRSELPEILPATRLGQLLTEQKPNWSVSNSWVNVR
ncbi:mitogen-activated protein kinase kinase kinase 20-like [Bidens hawaiensis]|uniref:mitogen-activated protein kinase kinase kinase 20-like n=1 Tax=Bidens hawaiensis TaxID=980011 RepID=UPI00404AE4FE